MLKLKEEEPDAVYIIYDDEAPFLRAAVKMANISILFHKTKEPAELTEVQKKSRSENGIHAVVNNNLLNLK